MKPGFVITVAAIMLGFFSLDRFLASLERRELASEARGLYAEGERQLAADRAEAAISPLQRAHTLVRDNRAYQLAFARALMGTGRLPEAEANLRQLLQFDSNDGAANLTMARLQARMGHGRQAEAFYHRAIYGTWPAGGDASTVRMELAEFLARRGAQEELLSELLLLQDEAGDNLDMQRKIAHLFLVAGSAGRSASAYRALLRRNPDDADAHVGLAEAEMASGDFNSAQVSLRRALRRRPDDQAIEERLRQTSTLTSLDPTPRRLTSRAKFDRSQQVVDLAKDDLAQCAQRAHAEEKLQPMIAEAEKQLKVRRPITNESAEALLDLAASMWQARVQACGEPSPDSTDPLPLLIRKIGQ